MTEEIRIVCKSGTKDCVKKVSGQSVWLKVGSLDWLFFMHGSADRVSHRLLDRQLERELRGGADGQAIAQAMLNQLVKAYTAEMVQAHMVKRPTVNDEGGDA